MRIRATNASRESAVAGVSPATRDWLVGKVPRKPVAAADVDTTSGDIVADFHTRFRNGAGVHHSAERFDAQAAGIYYEADDPCILGDQERAIRQLLKRRRETTSSPLITSYEEHDPRYGKWTMALLAWGRIGDRKLVDNSYIHLNCPPTTLPPSVVNIHLCWGTRFKGAPAASVLQAVVALVIDDWRDALTAVNVRFHLHRFGPDPRRLALGRGGRRWRRRASQHLPPSSAVGMLFERANRARSLSPFSVDAGASGLRQWWCLCLLEEDLPVLGFTVAPEAADRSAMWSATAPALPAQIETVIVVPHTVAAGQFYRVLPVPGGMRLVNLSPGREGVPIEHWARLRTCALDVALDELFKRMK